MYKVKIILFNIGICAVAGAIMQLLWVLVSGDMSQLTPYSILNMVGMSVIVGSICLFALFQVTLRSMGSLVRALTINSLLVIFLCVLIYLQTGIFFSNWSLDIKWIITIVIALMTAFIMTTVWYRVIMYYNNKLAKKKSSLLKAEERS
jgi:hypothetical protein